MLRAMIRWWDKHNSVWFCPTCGKLKRTLTKTHTLAPWCSHKYTPHAFHFPPARTIQRPR